MLNGFPVNGIASDGACNTEQVQLLPGSLRGRSNASGCEDADLDIDGDELVGRVGDKIECRGNALTGATFTLKSDKGSATLTIAAVSDAIQAGSGGYRVTSWGYKILYDQMNVCSLDGADAVRKVLGIPKRPEPWVPPGGSAAGSGQSDADYVIAVSGPLYDATVTAISDVDPTMFNLACAGDAIAKRTLYGLYVPANTRDARDANTAALHMLTATYCHRAYTTRGMEIAWHPGELRPLPMDPESKWRGSGALCIQNPRLLDLGIPPTEFPESLQPPNCSLGSNADPAKGIYGRCDGSDWRNAVTAESRSDCDTAIQNDCAVLAARYDFESYSFSTVPERFGFEPGTGSGSAAR